MATSRVIPLLLAAVLLAGLEARAATFLVNDTADAPDASPGDTVCETASGNGTCTLRAAVMEANALPGADIVTLPAGTYDLTRATVLFTADTEADGDLDVTESLDLVGAGATTTVILGHFAVPDDGVQPHRVLDVAAGTIVSLSGATISSGAAWGNGGGIANAGDLTLSDCVLRDSLAGFIATDDGGGIANAATGTLSVSRCTFVNNFARNGGGIANAGTASLAETTIEYNTAATGGGAANWGTLTIVNSTISGNSITFDKGFGAAIADHGGVATLEHVTVANSWVTNNSDGLLGSGAGLGVAAGVVATGYVLRDTIVWGSTGPSGGSHGDCGTPAPISFGHNIDGDGTCLLTEVGDLPSTDPGLFPLQNYGGPTETHAIAPGSPPHDAGDAGACPSTDQRGVPRPHGAGCDIGAFEVDSLCNNNGMLDPGEACDDGSPAAGDCCAFDCTFVASGVACEGNDQCTHSQCDGAGACVFASNASAGTFCQQDADGCTSERCDGAGACVTIDTTTCIPCQRCDPQSGICRDAVLTGCRRPTIAGASRLTLKPELQGSDFVKWRWRGAEPGSDDFGDPAATDDYNLCIFQTTGPGSTLLMRATAIPAGGTCGGKPCWTPLGTSPGERGFRYQIRSSFSGFASLLLRPGADGRARITCRAEGKPVNGYGTLDFPLDAHPPVIVQLQREDGTCWEAQYTTPLVSTAFGFKARSDP
jgi:CSLREA domain-containing protein